MIPLCRSSGQALRLLKEGKIHVAGVHLAAAGGREGNAAIVRHQLEVPAALLRIAQWDEGVAYVSHQQSVSLGRLRREPFRWVGREAGSGARQCLDEVIRLPRQPSRIATDHRAVAAALSSGWADAGVCIRLVSEEAGLRFLSVRSEDYDLIFLKFAEMDPRITALVRVVRSAAYRRLLAALPGYHVAQTGALETTDRQGV